MQSVEVLDVGIESTAAYRLALGPGGSLWATGNANDTTNPNATDLFVARLDEGSMADVNLFADDFEAGHLGGWSATSQ